jgi:hypothetical protein
MEAVVRDFARVRAAFSLPVPCARLLSSPRLGLGLAGVAS